MNWLTEPHNTVFTVAFIVMLCFAALETISLIFGLGLSDWLQDLLPHGGDGGAHADSGGGAADGHHAHADGSGDFAGHGGMMQSLLSWLEIGKLPLLVSMNIFFAGFSISGFIMQAVVKGVTGHALYGWLAGLIAFFVALPLLKAGNALFGKFWPRDESSAVHERDFIGCHGIITIGMATADRAAEVKFQGPDGMTHYVMAFASREELTQGSPVVLVKIHPDKPSHFFAIRNPDLAPIEV
jgi:hypothetical protein